MNKQEVRYLPIGCKIENIRRGTGKRISNIHANLVGPDGKLLIAATIEYIIKQLHASTFIPNEEFLKLH